MSECYNLKPCPFCGAEAYMWSWNYGTAIQCSKFNSNTHVIQVSAKTSAEAVERWNERVEAERYVLEKITSEIQDLRGCSCSNSDGIIDDVEDVIDKYKTEGSNG